MGKPKLIHGTLLSVQWQLYIVINLAATLKICEIWYRIAWIIKSRDAGTTNLNIFVVEDNRCKTRNKNVLLAFNTQPFFFFFGTRVLEYIYIYIYKQRFTISWNIQCLLNC